MHHQQSPGAAEGGGDGIVEVPRERWDAAAIYDADPDARGKSYCMRGGFVTPIDLFDAPFFGISPREARALDPAQRMMLEVTSEAIELRSRGEWLRASQNLPDQSGQAHARTWL